MSRTRRLFLALCACGVLVVALAVGPKLLLAYHSVSYVFGEVDPPGGPYDNVVFGTEGPGELYGGPSDDLLASEGPWGSWPEDYRPDRLYGGGGDDYFDAVSWPHPSVDVLRCRPGEDAVVADPQDDVGGDCEEVRRVYLGPVPHIGDPLPEFPPEDRMRRYGPNPYEGRAPE
jgi:hypothetical protein